VTGNSAAGLASGGIVPDAKPQLERTVAWLLDSDPAIRWQVQRDLLHTRPAVYHAERARVATHGWGADLLARQAADGHWGGGIYSPKWISTTYTLLLLRHLGLPRNHAAASRACAHFFFLGLAKDGGINLFKSFSHSETCVNGMLLALLSYFQHSDPRTAGVVEFLLRAQMDDGGWNCRRVHGATHGSFHTTISVLEGLAEHAGTLRHVPAPLNTATTAGREFLLRHRLFKSHRTGRIVDPQMTRFHFPPQWRYDVLRALDYYRLVDAPRDRRLADAIVLLKRRRSSDGTWVLSRHWNGRTHFSMESTARPSRWNTLRALRVLEWWAA
jgi:hypothetical protein